MIPSILASQLEQGIRDFLRFSFEATSSGFDSAIERFLEVSGQFIKGPHVQVSLPFVRGSRPDFFPKVPLPFTPHRHQELAFQRLGGTKKRSTLIATGTGSGKSESFLWPILAHCEAHASEPGIKAILIYPMNALATDQALRVARAIEGNSNLKGKVRAGLYIGDDGSGETHGQMGSDHIITSRETLQASPPDILLTNYKMLDFLMVRPRDRRLWKGSTSGSLRFLVVDEIHTFDGAQGTDLASLIRRLKARLHLEKNQLCCVGTSATLGGPEAGAQLREYAAKVFGETFDADSIVGEVRQTSDEFFSNAFIKLFETPTASQLAELDSAGVSPDEYLIRQAKLWLGAAPTAPFGSDAWAVELGERLLEHATLRNLLPRVAGAPKPLDELVSELSRAVPAFKTDPELGRRALVSFLSLVSAARVWREELPAVAAAREKAGKARPVDPFLQVRVQIWVRELRRIVGDIGPQPNLRFSDDLTVDERRRHLPIIFCRDCGAMGWAALHRAEAPDTYQTELSRFYGAYFSKSADVRFLFPKRANPPKYARERRIHSVSLKGQTPSGELGENEHDLLELQQVRGGELVTDCPFCSMKASLSLVGFQAATLTSSFIDQLFASPWNDDKKLLAFSDSVQDASQRAGFIGARTWHINVRVALAQHLLAQGDVSLSDLAAQFPASLRKQRPPEQFVGEFLPPNLEWLHEFEDLKEKGVLAPGGQLADTIERRLTWEVLEEFGLRSRIGRSLTRTALVAVTIDPARLEAVIAELMKRLPQEIESLRDLTPQELRRVVLGLLHHLREQGGIMTRLLPESFIESAGKNAFMFRKIPHLPDLSSKSRLPVMLSNRAQGRFEQPWDDGTWYSRWCFNTLGATRPLLEPQVVYSLMMEALTTAGILESQPTKQPQGTCWGLAPAAAIVTRKAQRIRCDTCGYTSTIAEGVADLEGAPCLSACCVGTMAPAPARKDYYAQLYERGEVARIVATEHTGLLDRAQREAVEEAFKRGTGRKPWDPNLLSCTPTLEMGIDVGDLSSVVLCSVPPAQANYLQRIGRGGRRDGNSLVLTIANARNHDLYFFEAPHEMMAGEVRPPGLYLDASAVLERQLTAWCFDRWAESVPNESALPRKLRDVYPRLGEPQAGKFPHDFREFVEENRQALQDGFREHFGDALSEASLKHLEVFLIGNDTTQAGLMWRLLTALSEEKEQSAEYQRQIERLRERIKKEEEVPTLDDAGKERLSDLRREHSALSGLRSKLDQRDILNFLTDEGLLPNYAFPEAAVRLRSVIWKKKSDDAGYETWSYEYDRPGEAALSELAPASTFYAGGRKVQIDQVDLQASKIERWRFCDQCDHAALEVTGNVGATCPMCGSTVWADSGRVLTLVQLRQVFAGTSDRDSRSSDERDDRVLQPYRRDTQVTFKDEAISGAWALGKDTEPFGWEFLAEASFREINFGKTGAPGAQLKIAGQDAVRPGFIICNLCGKLQPGGGKPAEHTPSCKARNPQAQTNFIECVYLYRAFESEAVRILLPIVDFAADREVQSLVAGIQTGLRLYFGGRVDHIRTTIETEPVEGSSHRRQYLVLYDAVPGGTGYLKELVRDPSNFFDLLDRAREHIAGCSCSSNPDRDGCYRCVFAYRNSFDMQDISRATAVALLSSILGKKATLETVKALSDVSIKGLVDSALERKFIEVLRRAGTDSRPSKLEKAFVAGKPGWRWTFGERVWEIEPQKGHSSNDGFGVGISIDFVLHPVGGAPGEKPIAVFLDGWQYHSDRVGLDLLQRMSAKASGRYVVWCFTWDDVADALNGTQTDVPWLLAPGPVLSKFCEQLGFKGAPGAVLEKRPIELFLSRVAGELDSRALRVLGGATLLASVTPTDATAWSSTVDSAVPAAASDKLSLGAGPLLALAQAKSQAIPSARLVGVEQAQLKQAFASLAAGQSMDTLKAAFVLHDAEDTSMRRREWASLLRTWNLLSELGGNIFFFSQSVDEEELDYSGLWSLLMPRPSADSAWAAVYDDVSATYVALVHSLEEHGVPVPRVGMDLPDSNGHSCGHIAELMWESRRVAVVDDESLAGAKAAAADGWTLLGLQELQQSVSSLLDALAERKGSGA